MDMEDKSRRVYLAHYPGSELSEWIIKIENGGDGSFNGYLPYPTFWAARASFPEATLEESAEQWLRDNNFVRGPVQR
jgi:hypothetical protein